MGDNCDYCGPRPNDHFVFPDGTSEPIGKWCGHPTDATQTDQEEVSAEDLF
jgi:hypothetical protein